MRWAFVVIPLLLLLASSIWYASQAWTGLGDDAMPIEGYYAMFGGILFSVIIGCGLMALVFYSHRRGYDDAASAEVVEDKRD